jgi:hypothetical protein
MLSSRTLETYEERLQMEHALARPATELSIVATGLEKLPRFRVEELLLAARTVLAA